MTVKPVVNCKDTIWTCGEWRVDLNSLAQRLWECGTNPSEECVCVSLSLCVTDIPRQSLSQRSHELIKKDMSFAIIVFITLAILVFQVVIAFIKNYKTRLSAKHLRDFKRKFSSNECKSIRIDRNLAFSRAEQSTRSLCLIFGWFVAKRKHLNNYRNVYLNRGFDVLIIR